VTTLLMLVVSNVFMTLAWYGHLKFDNKPLWLLIVASWGIAFFEYCLVIPANRIGFAQGLTVGQLKVMQEVVTLLVFAVFAALVMGEKLGWKHLGAFVCLVGAVLFMFWGKVRPA